MITTGTDPHLTPMQSITKNRKEEASLFEDMDMFACKVKLFLKHANNYSRMPFHLVTAMMTELKHVSLFSSIRLVWVPGHSTVTGNKTAGRLAKQTAWNSLVLDWQL